MNDYMLLSMITQNHLAVTEELIQLVLSVHLNTERQVYKLNALQVCVRTQFATSKKQVCHAFDKVYASRVGDFDDSKSSKRDRCSLDDEGWAVDEGVDWNEMK